MHARASEPRGPRGRLRLLYLPPQHFLSLITGIPCHFLSHPFLYLVLIYDLFLFTFLSTQDVLYTRFYRGRPRRRPGQKYVKDNFCIITTVVELCAVKNTVTSSQRLSVLVINSAKAYGCQSSYCPPAKKKVNIMLFIKRCLLTDRRMY